MRVHAGVEKTVVFIGRNDRGPFVPYGTGFLVAHATDEVVYQTVVTARHVLDKIGNASNVAIRINTRGGPAEIIPTSRKSWVGHPNPRIDATVCPIRLLPDKYDFLLVSLNSFLTNEIIEKHKIGVGDDITVCGMFLSRLGEMRNLPIVRSGIISAMPSEEIETVYGYHHVYLVEARSTGGLSGSPVFAQMAPFRMIEDARGTPTVRASLDVLPQYFMGMMLGHNSLTVPEEDIEIMAGDRRTADERERDLIEYLIPLNTGIGVVLPHEYIGEVVMNPDLAQLRRELI